MPWPATFNLKNMVRLDTWSLVLVLPATACSGLAEPEHQGHPDSPIPRITSVHATITPLLAVGSTTKTKVVVVADSGVQYTVTWSLPSGTTAATIDAATGALTAVASGLASPTACATARLADGQSQTVCGEAIVRVVTVATPATGVGGRRLAFVREATVFVSASDGSEPVALVTNAARPAGSPDGTRIAFSRPAGYRLTKWQLCIARQDGSDVRCAIGERDGDVVGGPSWSPDGATVAFSVSIPCETGLCYAEDRAFSGLLLLNTLTMKVVSVDTPQVWSLSWSPDGRKIAVAMYGAGTFGRGALGTVSLDGSGLDILAPSLGSYSVKEVTWSPDGSRLGLSLLDEHACPWYCDTAIGVVNADGTQLKLLDRARTSDDVYLWAPAWSPDGTRLAYTVSQGDDCWSDFRVPCGSDIATVGVDDGRIELLLLTGGSPAWLQ